MQASSTKPEPKESAPSSGAVFESKKVAVYEGEDVIKAQSSQPWEVQSETGKKYQYLAVAPIQPKTGSVAMNIDIRPGTLYWDKKENALRAPKDYESTERVIPHEMVVMSDGAKSQPYIRYLLAVPPQSGGSEEEMLQSLLGQQSSQDRFKTKSYESFYVPASEENLKRLAGATDTGIDEWNKLKISLTKKATSGRQSASSGGAFINQGGGVAPQQNPVSGSSNTDKYAKYGATKR